MPAARLAVEGVCDWPAACLAVEGVCDWPAARLAVEGGGDWPAARLPVEGVCFATGRCGTEPCLPVEGVCFEPLADVVPCLAYLLRVCVLSHWPMWYRALPTC